MLIILGIHIWEGKGWAEGFWVVTKGTGVEGRMDDPWQAWESFPNKLSVK